MMRLPKFEYRAARTVDEALDWIGDLRPAVDKDPEARAMLMAGGTDVLPNMKHKVFTPQVVVGLRAVGALHGIDYDPDRGLRIGAGVAAAPSCRLAAWSERTIRRWHQAAASVSTPQLRADGNHRWQCLPRHPLQLLQPVGVLA